MTLEIDGRFKFPKYTFQQLDEKVKTYGTHIAVNSSNPWTAGSDTFFKGKFTFSISKHCEIMTFIYIGNYCIFKAVNYTLNKADF